jgi:hypothetical protein
MVENRQARPVLIGRWTMKPGFLWCNLRPHLVTTKYSHRMALPIQQARLEQRPLRAV